ncbi:MAG: DUF2062 domain-containing protein [Phycisphaerae bacterium]
MARRFLRKYLPARERLQGDKRLARFGSLLRSPLIWQLNRHTVSKGVAVGVFWGFIPMVGQQIVAIFMAIRMRANVPLALAFTWISNPLTWGPIWYFCYKIGVRMTGVEPTVGFTEEMLAIKATMDELGFLEGFKTLGVFMLDNISRVLPLMVGSISLGIVASLSSYLACQWAWRANIARKWSRSGHTHKPRQIWLAWKGSKPRRLRRSAADRHRPTDE